MKGKEDQILDIIRNHTQVTKNDIVINKAAMAADISKVTHEHYMRFLTWFTRMLIPVHGGWIYHYGNVNNPQFETREDAYDHWLKEVESIRKNIVDPNDDLAK